MEQVNPYEKWWWPSTSWQNHLWQLSEQYDIPLLFWDMGVSTPALLQPLCLDCELGGKQKSHRVYSLSQVHGPGELASCSWHIHSSLHSCCHLTDLHISQSEELTRLPKWSHHCVAGRGKQLKWRELRNICPRSKHSPQIDPSTSSCSEITYHPLLWGAGQSCLCCCSEVGDFQWAAGE